MESKVGLWLNDYSGKTQEDYRSRIHKFFEQTGLSEEALNEKDATEIKHIVINWFNHNPQSQNSKLSVLTAVRSYCSSDYVKKPLSFRRDQFGQVEPDLHSHIFTQADLRAMFEVGGTFEKAVLATATSLGWEISSFLKLDRAFIKGLVEKAKADGAKFVYFDDTRKKTKGTRRLGVLNPLALEWLDKYLETNLEHDPRLFVVTDIHIAHILKRLSQDAGIKVTGKLRFHRLRAYVESSLSRAGMNTFQISFIMGHSLPTRDRGYLLTLREEIEQLYPKAYETLNIAPSNGNVETKKKVEALSTTTEQLVQMLSEEKAKNEDKDKTIADLKTQLQNNTNTVQKLLDLPTIAREMRKAKDKVPID